MGRDCPKKIIGYIPGILLCYGVVGPVASRLETMAEAFNSLNHRNDMIPNATWGTGAYPTAPNATFGATEEMLEAMLRPSSGKRANFTKGGQSGVSIWFRRSFPTRHKRLGQRMAAILRWNGEDFPPAFRKLSF